MGSVESCAPGAVSTRNGISVLGIENENILGRLAFGCRANFSYIIFQDGRILVVWCEGACGLVATLSDHVRRLIAPRSGTEA